MFKLYKKYNLNDSFGYDEIIIKMWNLKLLVFFVVVFLMIFFFVIVVVFIIIMKII